MKLLLGSLGVVLAFAAGCGGVAAAPPKPSAPPSPVVKYRNALPGQTAGTATDLVQNVLDFGPGASSIVHTHTTPNLATVLQGRISVKTPDGDRQGVAGAGLVEPLNQPVQAVNAAADETMVAVAFAVPHGGKPTTPVAGEPAPAVANRTLFSYTLAAPTLAGGYSIVQQVLEFAPTAQTPKQKHGGLGAMTVLSGQVTVAVDGQVSVYSTGDSFSELPGQTLQLSNQGAAGAVVVASFLLPDGGQL